MINCDKCGGRLKYKCLYNFSDPNLGVSSEWYECENCGERVSMKEYRHKKQKGARK